MKGDQGQIKSLLASRERGVDERTSTGATPLMLACLFGRFKAFLVLLSERADLGKCDNTGFKVAAYVLHNPFAKDLVHRYGHVVGVRTCRRGRKSIMALLRQVQGADKPRSTPEVEAAHEDPGPTHEIAPRAPEQTQEDAAPRGPQLTQADAAPTARSGLLYCEEAVSPRSLRLVGALPSSSSLVA